MSRVVQHCLDKAETGGQKPVKMHCAIPALIYNIQGAAQCRDLCSPYCAI